MATPQEVFGHHVDSFGKLDVDEVIKDFDENSVLIGPMGTFKGASQIRNVFAGMFDEFAKPGMTFEMLADPVIEGDCVYIQWKGETADNIYEYVTDTFLIRDGKIALQTFGGKIVPKG
jgi:ketosteroid isomerase-like protein